MLNSLQIITLFALFNSMITPCFAQHINFNRNEDGEVLHVTYRGSSRWLAAQEDKNSHLHLLPKLDSFAFHNHKISQEEFDYVTSLQRLRFLSVGGDSEAVQLDAPLSGLSKLQLLEDLELWVGGLQDEDLTVLKSLPKLNWLVISEHDLHDRFDDWPKLTDVAGVHIAAACSLEGVQMPTGGLYSDLFVLRLSKLPKLQFLEVSSTKFTDTSLAIIAKNCQLKELEIYSPNFTDEGVHSLSEMHSLESLTIGSPKLTNKSIQSLKALKRLKKLIYE